EPHAPTQRPHADRPTRPDRHPVPATFDREIVTSDTHVSREFGGDAHSAHTHVATAPSPIRSTPTPSARRTASASDTANTVNTASVSGCSTCTCHLTSSSFLMNNTIALPGNMGNTRRGTRHHLHLHAPTPPGEGGGDRPTPKPPSCPHTHTRQEKGDMTLPNVTGLPSLTGVGAEPPPGGGGCVDRKSVG